MSELTSQTSGTVNTGIEVFRQWVMTPVGATIALILLAIGAVNVVMRTSGTAGTVLNVVSTVAIVLFFLWIIGGVCEAMGIPVRETVRQMGAYLPDVGTAFMKFLKDLFDVSVS